MKISLLREFISTSLLEGRVEDAKKKYPKLEKDVDYFVGREPKGSNSKYLDWELKILSAKQALAPEIADVIDLFDRYSVNLKKKDVNSYSAQEFTKLRDDLFDLAKRKSKKKEKTKEKYEVEGCEADVVYEDDEHRVLHIKNKAASVHYGLGTKWCITMKNQHYFEDYDKNNTVFFFILNKSKLREDPTYKIAVSIPRDHDNNLETDEIQFWNALDADIGERRARVAVGSDADVIINTIMSAARKASKSIAAKIDSGEGSADDCEKFYEYMSANPDMFENDTGALIRNKNVPDDVLRKLISHDISFSHDRILHTIAELAISSKILDELLEQAIKEEDMALITSIALNRHASDDTLKKITSIENVNVHQFLIRNPRAPKEFLRSFAEKNFKNIFTLEHIAKNPNTPDDIIEKLSRHSSYFVRKNVTANPNLKEDVALRLAMPTEILEVRIGMGRHYHGGSQQVLNLLRQDKSDDVRYELAVNPNIDENTMLLLAGDEFENVRYGVVRNTNATKRVLEKLTNDPSNINSAEAESRLARKLYK
jgi:hypothetical protein